MSVGIHVFNLPETVTEKQLKVYFSNPRNGGGHVKQILHPLVHNSAIILYDSQHTVKDIVQRRHVLREQPLSVQPLPKQIFGSTKVDLQKSVSQYLERHPQVVDELQFVGELAVDFHYDKEIYILTGQWYQLEWALCYLDGLLDEKDLKTKPQPAPKFREQNMRKVRDENDDLSDEFEAPEPVRHEIQKPNIPVVKNKKGKVKAKFGQKIPIDVAVRKAEERELAAKLSSKTIHKNLADKNKDKKVHNDFEEKRYLMDRRHGTKADKQTFQNRLDDSDSEDDSYGTYDTGEEYRRKYEASSHVAKSISFGKDTNFTEDKPRPTRNMPKRTKGIDVAQTDFGEIPLQHSFTLPNDVKVMVAMDDITKQTTDGIVNPTSPDLSSVFGASRAIVLAGGYEMHKQLQEFLNKNGSLQWAQVFHTNSSGTLHKNVVNVLHTASPLWREEDGDIATHYLVCTYINLFMYADTKLWLQSISTPVISSGAFGFPLDICIQAFYDALLLFSTHGPDTNHLKEINLICFDGDTSMAAIVILQSLFDCDTTQAVSAATDRYNSRYLNCNFSAENFSTDALKSKQTSQNKTDKSRKHTTTTQKNKNTKVDHMARDEDVKERVSKDKLKSNDYGSKEQTGKSRDVDDFPDELGQLDRLSLFNRKQTVGIDSAVISSDDDGGDDDDERQQEMNRYSLEKARKQKREKKIGNQKYYEGSPDSPRSSLRDMPDKKVENDRGSPEPDTEVRKIDAKKSLASIDRPKFTNESVEDEDNHSDEGGFDVGIIGADKYFKKFEDLIELDTKADDQVDVERKEDDANMKEDYKQSDHTLEDENSTRKEHMQSDDDDDKANKSDPRSEVDTKLYLAKTDKEKEPNDEIDSEKEETKRVVRTRESNDMESYDMVEEVRDDDNDDDDDDANFQSISNELLYERLDAEDAEVSAELLIGAYGEDETRPDELKGNLEKDDLECVDDIESYTGPQVLQN